MYKDLKEIEFRILSPREKREKGGGGDKKGFNSIEGEERERIWSVNAF